MPAFTIPGRPYGKKRPRFSRKSGRAYDPAGNAETEDAIGSIALPHFPYPLEGPVALHIIAGFSPAASWSKKRKAVSLGQPHTQKPDCDNLGKTVMDALNRIAWADDSQVAEVSVTKRWTVNDATIVTVEAL